MKLGMQTHYNPASSLLGHTYKRNISTGNALNGTVDSIRNWSQPRSMSLGVKTQNTMDAYTRTICRITYGIQKAT